MSQRIVGYDFARALAIFGMVIVNFKFSLLAWGGSVYWQAFVSLFEGRAAALFVVLAGVGVTLMTRTAKQEQDVSLMYDARKRIIKRGLLLLAIGLPYASIWSADILHFYGLYFLLAASLLYVKDRSLIIASILIVLAFPMMLVFLDYDAGWDWNTYTYHDFWTHQGMIRHVVFNGFYPVFPWAAFLVFGMWLARQNLSDPIYRKKLLTKALVVWLSIEIIFLVIKKSLSAFGLNMLDQAEINFLFQTSMMPPMPQYIVAGASLATVIILASLHYTEKCAGSRLVNWLSSTGRLSLTLYILHVVVGIGILKQVDYAGKHSIVFSVISALVFCMFSIIFSVYWLRFFKFGPLEWMFRKITK